MDEPEVYEITEEEYAVIKAKAIAELKDIPEWWDKLGDCHIKCSDFDHRLAVHLWMILDKDDLDELYAEAERIRNEQEASE